MFCLPHSINRNIWWHPHPSRRHAAPLEVVSLEILLLLHDECSSAAGKGEWGRKCCVSECVFLTFLAVGWHYEWGLGLQCKMQCLVRQEVPSHSGIEKGDLPLISSMPWYLVCIFYQEWPFSNSMKYMHHTQCLWSNTVTE